MFSSGPHTGAVGHRRCRRVSDPPTRGPAGTVLGQALRSHFPAAGDGAIGTAGMESKGEEQGCKTNQTF